MTTATEQLAPPEPRETVLLVAEAVRAQVGAGAFLTLHQQLTTTAVTKAAADAPIWHLLVRVSQTGHAGPLEDHLEMVAAASRLLGSFDLMERHAVCCGHWCQICGGLGADCTACDDRLLTRLDERIDSLLLLLAVAASPVDLVGCITDVTS